MPRALKSHLGSCLGIATLALVLGSPSPGYAEISELSKDLLANKNICWVSQVRDRSSGLLVIEFPDLPSATGSQVNFLTPPTTDPTSLLDGSIVTHTVTGNEANVFRPTPCPPPGTKYTGWWGGTWINKTVGGLTWAEFVAATGTNTNSGKTTGDPLGFGFNVGYGFRPWNNNIVVSPFVSLDFPNVTINQNFPGGSYLGTKSNYEVLAGVKIGPTLESGVWLYAMGGFGFLNEQMRINFIPLFSSTNTTVPGGFLGLGAAIQPSFLQGFGRPISLSLEYQHAWWAAEKYNTPTASPLFNYTFNRQDDVFKFGVTVYFSQPTPPPAPRSALITK